MSGALQAAASAGAAPLAALALAAMYALGPRVAALAMTHPRRWLSLAAGASMAYVFLDALPELSARHRSFLELAGEVPFAAQRLYLLALVGFVSMYGLDRLVLAARKNGDATEEKKSLGLAFWFHIGGFALYSWLIGYILPERTARGWLSLCLYTAAMGFHFLVVACSLERQHGRAYDTRGRWVLAASVTAGWLVAIVAPLPEVAVSRLFAFVAGGVVMTSANEELPKEREGRFGWFVLGAAGYGALLLAL